MSGVPWDVFGWFEVACSGGLPGEFRLGNRILERLDGLDLELLCGVSPLVVCCDCLLFGNSC